jgi:transposase
MDMVLMVSRARVARPNCGPKLEALDWLEPHARVTNRLAENVARMCKVMPIKHMAEHYNLHWSTVKEIDKAYLKRELEPAKRGNVRLLLMDEVATHKGHRYATVIMDAETRRVLWVGKGPVERTCVPSLNGSVNAAARESRFEVEPVG